MSRDLAENDQPVHFEQLVELFSTAVKGDARLGVGTEHEKFGFLRDSLRPVPYEGEQGIGRLLQILAEERGYKPLFDSGNILALEKDGGAVTLEPGGQLELSGKIAKTIFETRDELRAHLSDVREVGESLGQVWTHMALNPWDDLEDVPWMPKSRYHVMRRYLPTRGALAHWMMKMTSTVQANYDFRTEADAMEMLRLTSTVGPLATAMFANSPYRFGKVTEFETFRMHVWEDTDPDRCGIPDFFLDPGAGFQNYVDYLLDVPMFFITRGGKYIDLSGIPFRQFLERGHEGHLATWGDWQLHQSTVFPDTRLKQYLELRTCDAGPETHLLAMPAIFKGLLYDTEARREAFALLPTLDGEAARDFGRAVARSGLTGSWRGLDVRELATELVHISARGLDRQAIRDEHPTEREFVMPLLGDDGRATNPATRFRTLWESCDGDRRTVIEATSILP
jgi:glutamate--cysteine ligase